MANDAKKVSELGITTSLSANDRIVVLTNPTSTPVTQTITLSNLVANSIPKANTIAFGVIKVGNNLSVNATGFLSTTINGPFTNDATANAGGVLLTGFYYDSAGNVKIRLT
jgi:hypothetical protein